jgi:DNA-binding MarR family transcriptional regulator
MPPVSKSATAALKLLELGEGKSVSQIAGEFGFSPSDVVCIVTPFVRAALVGRKAHQQDWRQDIYFSQHRVTEDVSSSREIRLKAMRDDIARLKSEMTRLQDELVRKEETARYARQVAVFKSLNIGSGKITSEIQRDTKLDITRIYDSLEPLVQSGLVDKRYVNQGQFFYHPTKTLREVTPVPSEEEIRKLRIKISDLKDEVTLKEETVRKEIKLAVLRSLDIGQGKSARQIAHGTGMSIADVIGVMMTFVRSGLVDQRFTTQGFLYAPPTLETEGIVEPVETEKLEEIGKQVEEVAAKKAVSVGASPIEAQAGIATTVTPVEVQASVVAAMSARALSQLGQLEELLEKMTVRELVLLREKVNLELRKRY